MFVFEFKRGEAGDAGPDREQPLAVGSGIPGYLLGHLRADQAHPAPPHVDQLGQFIQLVAQRLSLTHTLSQRVARFPEKRRLLERDVENSDLVYEQQEEDVMQQLYGYSVTYSYRSGPTSSSKDFHIANLATACG